SGRARRTRRSTPRPRPPARSERPLPSHSGCHGLRPSAREGEDLFLARELAPCAAVAGERARVRVVALDPAPALRDDAEVDAGAGDEDLGHPADEPEPHVLARPALLRCA